MDAMLFEVESNANYNTLKTSSESGGGKTIKHELQWT